MNQHFTRQQRQPPPQNQHHEEDGGGCGTNDAEYGTGDDTVEVDHGLFGGGAGRDRFERAVWGGRVGVGAVMEGYLFGAEDEGVFVDGRRGNWQF